MPADGLNSTWPGVVIDWITQILRLWGDPPYAGGVVDMSLGFGLQAMVALGQMEERAEYFHLRSGPILPDPLPRWDDCALLAVNMASRLGRLNIPFPDGTPRPKPVFLFLDAVERAYSLPTEQIAPAHGLGLALATPDFMAVLHALGLVIDGQWSPTALPVLWRVKPTPWDIWFDEKEPRFAVAVASAVQEIPDDIRAELARLCTITEGDIVAEMARIARVASERPDTFNEAFFARRPNTPENARVFLEQTRTYHLDTIFRRRWRLSDGWLSPSEAKRALEVYPDPLSTVLSRSVLSRLHSNAPEPAR